ncbi:hypothetical protein BH18ACI2_BH18ACI2_25550 [soil metagenome]
MSEEEMQRQMEFIVEQQAQFVTDIQRSRETQEAEAKLWREKYNGLTDALTTVVGIVGKLAERVEEIAEAQKRTDAQLAETNAQLAETNERLNVFINVVERYISERRNGQSGRVSGNEADESASSS